MTPFSHLRLVEDVQNVVRGDKYWEDYMGRLSTNGATPFSLHLAVMVEPFLRFMLDGTKTVESRFSVNRCAPYGRVGKGDVILLKKSGGPIVGLCAITYAWFYQLDPASWRTIRDEFGKAICAQDPAFWQERQSANYATLMRVRHVRTITPIKFEKRDRRGWVVLREAPTELPLLKGTQ
jgi:hypothetical protein